MTPDRTTVSHRRGRIDPEWGGVRSEAREVSLDPVRPGSRFEELASHQGELERIVAPDPAEFRRRFRRPRRPVVLTDATARWPARERWSFEFFRREYGRVDVRVGTLFDKQETLPLGKYLDGMAGERELPRSRSGLPLYLEGWYFLRGERELADDYFVPACMGPDWFARFFRKRLYSWSGEILIGPAGAFTKLHVDSHGTPGWLAQLVGRKRWVLAPPEDLAHAFRGRKERAGGYPGLEHESLLRDERTRDVRYWTATIGPGDLIYVPGNWYHQVTILEDSISLTHNFFNSVEAPRVLYELAHTFVRSRLSRDRGEEGAT